MHLKINIKSIELTTHLQNQTQCVTLSGAKQTTLVHKQLLKHTALPRQESPCKELSHHGSQRILTTIHSRTSPEARHISGSGQTTQSTPSRHPKSQCPGHPKSRISWHYQHLTLKPQPQSHNLPPIGIIPSRSANTILQPLGSRTSASVLCSTT